MPGQGGAIDATNLSKNRQNMSSKMRRIVEETGGKRVSFRSQKLRHPGACLRGFASAKAGKAGLQARLHPSLRQALAKEGEQTPDA